MVRINIDIDLVELVGELSENHGYSEILIAIADDMLKFSTTNKFDVKQYSSWAFELKALAININNGVYKDDDNA